MATRRIETTIALDGEQAFKKGLAAAAREMRVLESESKALAASFGTSGDAAAAAAAKQRNLQNQVAQQEQIVSALEQAVKDAAKAYGESSAEVDGYAIKLNNARTRLANLQKALTNSDREVEELGRDAIKAGRQIEDGIGDGAREAQNELTDLMTTMQDSLSAIQSNTAVTAIKTVWDMASGAYSAVDGFVSGTVDYRRQLSFLELNADQSGFDFTRIKEKLLEITAITGDASSSIETLSNLMAVPGIETNTMERAIEGLAGAVISFPETIKFESLADSLQETLASGAATGQFAELLSRMGVDVESFNKALEESPTAVGDLEVALAYLANGGLNDTYTKWKDTNEEMSDALTTQAAIEDELAEFAATLEKYVTTPTKKAFLDAITYANDLIGVVEEEGLGVAIEKLEEDIDKGMAAAGMPTTKDFVESIEQITPMGMAANILDRMGWREGADLARQAFGIAKPDLIKNVLPDWGNKPYDQSYADALYESGVISDKQKEYLDGYYANLEQDAAEAGREAGQQFAEGFEEWLDPTTWGEGKEVTSLKVIGQRSMEDALAGIDLDAYYKEMNGAGKEGASELVEGLEDGTAGAEAAAQAAGASFGVAYAQGIMSQVSYVSAAAGALAAAAAARAAAAAVTPSAGIGGGLNLALNLDGKTFARIAAPYMSDAMAVDAG